MDHGHIRSRAIEIERSFRRRVFPSNYDHILPPKGMRFGVVMGDVRQIFAGHAKAIREVVVAGSDNYFPGGKLRDDTLLVARMHTESSIRAASTLSTRCPSLSSSE